ncbi:MAG: hypothetical protein JW973_14890 [Bacteroidales bacterium]|nr:hypothetical protein [Bacteroidales bacterium]
MKRNFPCILKYTASGVFFILTFVYCWHYLDPSLIYFKQQPLFLFDKLFFYKYTGYPGGIAEYLSLFISQFFFSRVAGSIVLAILVMAIVFLSYQLLSCYFSKDTSYFLQFLPGLLLIHLHSRYDYDLSADLIVIAALVSGITYHKIISRSPLFRSLFLVITTCLLFWLFGGSALLLYSIIVMLAEIYSKNHRFFWLLCFFQLFICFLLAVTAFVAFPGVARIAEFPIVFFTGWYKNASVYLYVLYGIIPVFLIFRIIIHYTLDNQRFYQHFVTGLLHRRRFIVLLLIPCVILGLLLADCKLSFDRQAKDAVQIHAYAAKKDWNAVLETAKSLPLTDRKVIFQVNRALYHLNRLPDESFSYPQYWGENGLVLTAHYSRDVLMLCSDLYFDMGHCKESLHWAYEAQTKSEQSPEVMERIALNNMIIGEYKAAEKFLYILSKSPVYKKWARHYVSCIKDETLMEKETLIREKRKLMPRMDFFTNTQQPHHDMYILFTENNDNKMAFEYFMMYSMLIHDLSKVAVHISYLDTLHYRKIPTHMEEALLLFMTLNQEYRITPGKLHISEQTQRKFAAYSQIMMRYQKDMKAAQAELYNQFGNTYWYYIHYISPLTTKRKIHEKPI